MAERRGILHPVPLHGREHFVEGDRLHLELIGGREHAVDQLGGELVEAVADEVVRDGDLDEVPADLDHLHAVADRLRKVEDVLDRARVEHHRKPVLERAVDRRIHVVKRRSDLVIGLVERRDVLGAVVVQDELAARVHGLARADGDLDLLLLTVRDGVVVDRERVRERDRCAASGDNPWRTSRSASSR